MEKAFAFIKSRLREPSTIRGLILIFVAISGANLSPEDTQNLVTHALGIVGLFGLFPDKMPGKTSEEKQENEDTVREIVNEMVDEEQNK